MNSSTKIECNSNRFTKNGYFCGIYRKAKSIEKTYNRFQDAIVIDEILKSGLLPPHFLSPDPIEDLRAFVNNYLKT